MADISKISPDGGTTEYNIKDTTARTGVSTINGKIPSGASSSNKMATASDVAAKISWADAGKSVKQNMFNYEAWKGVHVEHGTGNFINNGVDLTSTADACYTAFAAENYPVNARIPVKEGDRIKLTWDLGANSASGNVMLFPNGIPDSSTWVSVANTTKKLEYTAQSGVAFVTFRVGINTSGNVAHYKNIMATLNDVPVDVTKYVPYIPDNTELLPRSEQVVLGAKQLIPYPYVNTTKTENNVTFTDNGDGTVTISTSDTVSADTFFVFFTEATMSRARLLKYKKMILSGGISSNVFLQFWNTDGNGGIAFSNGNENVVDFTNASASFNLVIVVKSGTTLAEPVTVSPLLRLATDPNPDFESFAMTNRELTDAVTNKVLSSSDDLDNIIEQGTYIVTSAPTHSPENKGYYTMLVYPVATDGQSVIQLVLHGENAIYYRRRSGSPISWKSWVKVEGTVLS